jgi:rhodanese-related sulfurtransferase
MNQISVSELHSLGDVSIIDVREVDEFSSGHVPHAVNIPLALVPLRVSDLSRQTRHYLICQAGGRSAQACMYLEQQGFDVVNVAGGTGEWIASGFPVD